MYLHENYMVIRLYENPRITFSVGSAGSEYISLLIWNHIMFKNDIRDAELKLKFSYTDYIRNLLLLR